MESKDQNVELINEAIKRLLEERKNNRGASGDDDDLLLSRLLSQLESLKDKPREEITRSEGGGELEASGGGREEIDKQESERIEQVKETEHHHSLAAFCDVCADYSLASLIGDPAFESEKWIEQPIELLREPDFGLIFGRFRAKSTG